MSSTSKILVPVDFSEQSILALEEALIFAKTMNSEIVLLSVIEDHGMFYKLFSGDQKKEDQVRQEIQTKLDELMDTHSEQSGIKMDTMIARGVVYEEVSRVVDLIGAELVVMGTNGKPANFRKQFIGSNAYRVVSMVKVPVITIRGIQQIKEIKTIIFPIVLERNSKEKVGTGLHYARLFDAEIKLVAVAKTKEAENQLALSLNQVEKFINDAGVSCTKDLVKIDESSEDKSVINNMLGYAYENGGDLVMIMEDEDDSELMNFIVGSSVQSVIYNSEIPVMSVAPAPKKLANTFNQW